MQATHMVQSTLVATQRPSELRPGACCISRRDASICLLSVAGSLAYGPAAASAQAEQLASPHAIQALRAAAVSAAAASDAAAAAAAAAAPPSSSSSIVRCSAQLDPSLAAAFIDAVYQTVQQEQVMPEQQLQVERYKLQTQEYKYYAAANQDRMPALPYLEDSSGGLSNSTYFNFVSYVLWKVVARHLPTPQQRTAFCAAAGGVLLQQLAPELLTSLKEAAAASGEGGGKAPAAAVIKAVQQLLNLLQQRGYICGWQLVLGSLPGGWPADWSVAEQQLVGLEDLQQQQQQQLPPGLQFQQLVGLEDLQQQQPLPPGLRFQQVDVPWTPTTLVQDWTLAAMTTALLAAGGYTPESVDKYCYQDSWQGPSSAAGKLLLVFGDPLQQVDVPWTPTTLVQDWTLA
uniref:Uncharacterized protein n=1 Tax=Tetradesmus obliquus TaxID=3088 RepID=A0A383VZF7_TETOB|eukprot:jgi/Sobl393_1/4738/SZX70310.1